MFSATHPGHSAAFPDQSTSLTTIYFKNATAQQCDLTKPLKKAEAMNGFNPDEIQKNVTIRFDNYPIPTARTTYVDIALNFPDDSEDLFHVVHADAVVENPDLLLRAVISLQTESIQRQHPVHLISV